MRTDSGVEAGSGAVIIGTLWLIQCMFCVRPRCWHVFKITHKNNFEVTWSKTNFKIKSFCWTESMNNLFICFCLKWKMKKTKIKSEYGSVQLVGFLFQNKTVKRELCCFIFFQVQTCWDIWFVLNLWTCWLHFILFWLEMQWFNLSTMWHYSPVY